MSLRVNPTNRLHERATTCQDRDSYAESSKDKHSEDEPAVKSALSPFVFGSGLTLTFFVDSLSTM